MKSIKTDLNQLNQNKIQQDTKEMIRPTDSLNLKEMSKMGIDQSKSLSLNVTEHLMHLMKAVTNDVNPTTVNAACNCATQIINLMKVNIQLKKSEMKPKLED